MKNILTMLNMSGVCALAHRTTHSFLRLQITTEEGVCKSLYFSASTQSQALSRPINTPEVKLSLGLTFFKEENFFWSVVSFEK